MKNVFIFLAILSTVSVLSFTTSNTTAIEPQNTPSLKTDIEHAIVYDFFDGDTIGKNVYIPNLK
jgi:hypothetical protein